MSDERVYVSRTSGHRTYHLTTACKRLTETPPDRLGERRRETLEAWGYEVCPFCGTDRDPAAEGGRASAGPRPTMAGEVDADV